MATVIQRPPSPWAQILGGLGEGIGSGFTAFVKKKLDQKTAAAQVLEAVATDKIDPMVLTSDIGQEFLKSMKIENRPEIQAAAAAGRTRFNDLNPPAPQTELPGGYATTIPTPTNPGAMPIPFNVVKKARVMENQSLMDAETIRKNQIELGARADQVKQDRRAELTFKAEDADKGKKLAESLRKAGYEDEQTIGADGSISYKFISPDQVKLKKEQFKLQQDEAATQKQRYNLQESVYKNSLMKEINQSSLKRTSIAENIRKIAAGEKNANIFLQFAMPSIQGMTPPTDMPVADQLNFYVKAANDHVQRMNMDYAFRAESLGLPFENFKEFSIEDFTSKPGDPEPLNKTGEGLGKIKPPTEIAPPPSGDAPEVDIGGVMYKTTRVGKDLYAWKKEKWVKVIED